MMVRLIGTSTGTECEETQFRTGRLTSQRAAHSGLSSSSPRLEIQGHRLMRLLHGVLVLPEARTK